MTSTPDAAASPDTIEVGGKTYTLVPLDWRAIGQYERYMRSEIVAAGREAAASIADVREKNTLIQQAYDAAGRLHVFSPNAVGFHSSIGGVMKLAFLSMLPNHPKITEADVYQMLRDKDVLVAVVEKIRALNEAVFGKAEEAKTEEDAGDQPGPKSGPA